MTLSTAVMQKATPSPRQFVRANTLFACQGDRARARLGLFDDVRRVTLPATDGFIGLEVATGTGADIQTYSDPANGCCAYLWGLAGHSQIKRRDLLKWMVEKVNAGDIQSLRDVAGMFIVLIDDRRNKRIRVISDLMGLRPFFVGRNSGQFVCGSDVWAMQDAGLETGGVNYDAVASWLRFGYDCTGGSLFNHFSAIGAGVVATWENGTFTEVSYAAFTGAQKTPSQSQIIEKIHHDMSRSFDALTGELDHVAIALSGGYDSRYLAALASKRPHLKLEAFSVRDREAEGVAASMVAEGLGISLQILRTDGAIWNIYEEPYHFTAGGFPMTKQTSFFAASQRPGVPCLNGFIGDPIVRGTLDRVDKKLERELQEDLPVVYQRHQRLKHTVARFDLLDGGIIDRSDQRTLALWEKHLKTYSATGHPIFSFGMFVRQRHYISNNFLQHLNISEAIVPFVTWDILQHKLQNDATCYRFETYEQLFRTFYPEIAHVPHNAKMGAANDLNPRPSRCTRQWAATVLKAIARSKCLPLLNRRKAIPRLMAAAMGRSDMDVVALFLYRLYMLDERLRRSGIEFDWYSI